MREKLVTLLRELENENGFKNEYIQFEENYQCDYSVEECLDFPNYRFVIKKLNDNHFTKGKRFISPISSNSISAELKRMEADGLVIIGVQDGIKYVFTKSNKGPDFDEDIKFTTESIILTTKGKSEWSYFLHKTTENPVTTVISLIAITISIITLFI